MCHQSYDPSLLSTVRALAHIACSDRVDFAECELLQIESTACVGILVGGWSQHHVCEVSLEDHFVHTELIACHMLMDLISAIAALQPHATLAHALVVILA